MSLIAPSCYSTNYGAANNGNVGKDVARSRCASVMAAEQLSINPAHSRIVRNPINRQHVRGRSRVN